MHVTLWAFAFCLALSVPRLSAARGVSVYFGNGCFWSRQKEFAILEQSDLGRSPREVTAMVGYAGGKETGENGEVCYLGPAKYDELGHAEVVQLELSDEEDAAREELRAFADKYFALFNAVPGGMERLDPQDEGPGYRNLVGLPGGMGGPLFPVVQAGNTHGMRLVEGRGEGEEDVLNTVFVMDSREFPFFAAEYYHQFHHGIGVRYSEEYVAGLKRTQTEEGRIAPREYCRDVRALATRAGAADKAAHEM